MCVHCINLTIQGRLDQSHCQLKLSSMEEGDMAKQPIMINQKAANLAMYYHNNYQVDLHTS